MEKLLDYWFKISDKIRFLFVGGFNFLCSYVIFVVMTLIIGTRHYQICNMLAWILSSFISYSTQRYFVFQSKGKWLHEYLKCCTTWFIGYLINAGLLEITVKILHLNVYLAQIISVGLTSIVTYILFKYFAFKKNKNL